MKPRRRREGKGAIVRAIREQGDRIVAAIRQASAEATAGRTAVIAEAADILRSVLDEGARRAVTIDTPEGRTVQFTANDQGGPANDDTPPESGPR